MNRACEMCGGLCCTVMRFSFTQQAGLSEDEFRWITFHGTDLGGGRVEFATACSKLDHGKCSIYNDRPQPCINFKVGGRECLDTIRRLAPHKLPLIETILEKGQ